MQTMLKVRKAGFVKQPTGKEIYVETWLLVPVDANCPYLFGYFDPGAKSLNLDSIHKKEDYEVAFKKKRDGSDYERNPEGYPTTKVWSERQEKWFSLVITDEEGIKDFLEYVCVNPQAEFPVSVKEDNLPPGDFVNKDGQGPAGDTLVNPENPSLQLHAVKDEVGQEEGQSA